MKKSDRDALLEEVLACRRHIDRIEAMLDHLLDEVVAGEIMVAVVPEVDAPIRRRRRHPEEHAVVTADVPQAIDEVATQPLIKRATRG
jgi:hypothetical protein